MSIDKTINEKIAWMITVCLFVSFILFENNTWGKYFFLMCSAFLAVLSYARDRKIHIRIGFFLVIGMTFSAYAALSSIWSIDSEASITMARTLIRTILCAEMFILYYSKEKSIEQVVDAIKWCGFIVSIYTIAYYGIDAMRQAALSASNRMGNGYSNVNTIAMSCCLSIIIQLNDFLIAKKKSQIGWILCIPALFVIITTQGRKALLMLLLGVSGLLITNLFSRKSNNSVFKRIMYIFLAVIVMLGVSQLTIFDGMRERFGQMMNYETGSGITDQSTVERAHMISVGITYWKKEPVFGYGFDATHVINLAENGRNDYLHNNYIELLCGGGVIALCIYYSTYLYFLYNSYRFRNLDTNYGMFCILWITILFILDYGMVSYYTKSQWFYIATIYIHVQELKRKAMEKGNKHVVMDADEYKKYKYIKNKDIRYE